MGTAYQTDPLLRLIPTDGIPASFTILSDAEQRWRGRMFLATWVLTGHEAYSWGIALADDPDGSSKATMAGVDDGALMAGLRGAETERRQAAEAFA